ncbi:MAG TPA: Ig-like domain-containing protein [Spirochaetota bacterium]|nr:Ig-like domain-containing protein [Spirochaetota bacterium]HPJ34760.1 Ig-like domain-containing protein [Spirochaetota bacterium]
MKRSLFIIVILLIAAAVSLSCDRDFDTLEIVSFSPGNRAINVAPESYIEIAFSSSVKKIDVEDNFILENSEGSLSGLFIWVSDSMFRFMPSDPMSKNGRYVIQLPRTIRDNKGNIMDSDFISEFYVGNDFTPPAVVASVPVYSAGAVTGVAVDQDIIINFSKSMNRESVEREFDISPDVAGYFLWEENVPGVLNSRLTYRLTANMEYGRMYTLRVSSSAEDSTGNSLGSDYAVNFITGDDFSPPEVTGIYDWALPGVIWGASTTVSGISRTVTMGVSFSKGMDRQSVEKAFSITPSLQGVFLWSSDFVVEFRPLTPLESETNYQISVDTTAKDRNQLRLSSRYTVEVVTDNPDSLYLKCGSVSGSNHDGDFTLLPGAWPVIIDMGSGTPVNRDYYIMIEFISDDSPLLYAEMDKYSIFDNVLLETFKGTTGIDEIPDSANIAYIEWIDDSTAKINITGMTNKSSGQVPALYRLTIAGGENGITDARGNYMKDDFIIEFREAMP